MSTVLNFFASNRDNGRGYDNSLYNAPVKLLDRFCYAFWADKAIHCLSNGLLRNIASASGF